MGLETAAIIALAGAAASGTASIIGANKQSNAAESAAKSQTDAANKAAELQSQAAAATLKFQQDQAAQSRADYITAQNASYGQYGYRQNVIRPTQQTGLNAENTLAQMLGLPAINTTLPDLPPPPQFGAPGGSGGSSGGSSSGGGAGPTIDPTKDIGQQVSAYFKSRGVSDAETPYWVQKWGEFGKNDPAYFGQRLSQADIFGKGGAPPPQTLGQQLGGPPTPPTAPTPAGTGVVTPYIFG